MFTDLVALTELPQQGQMYFLLLEGLTAVPEVAPL